jgi:RNA polymerase sigma-70 factor, ECF subfamily
VARAGRDDEPRDVERPDLGAAARDVEPDPRPSWDAVAAEYGDRIYAVAYRLTGDPHEAADLAQDVFVRVYRNLHRYEPGTFDGWLYRITKNLFLDSVRRRSRVRMEPLPEEEWRAPATSEPGPADVVERRTLEARLERGLAELGEDFRLAVVLCDIEGLTYEEIAETTGWPLGTVRSRIHRGRKQLRAHLDRHPPEDGEHRPSGRRGRRDGR